MRRVVRNGGLIPWVALLALISAGPAAAMSSAGQPRLAAAGLSNIITIDTNGDPVNGRRLFLANNCYICHGGRAGGGMCPSLRATRPNSGDVADALLNGKPQGMPSFAHLLTDFDIADLAAYIKSLRSANEPTFVEWWLPLPL